MAAVSARKMRGPSDSATVSVFDRRLNVSTISVAPNPRRIEADSATHRVYVSNENSPGTVTVIDGTTNTVVKTIPVGNAPRGLGSNFLIGRLYVSNTASNTINRYPALLRTRSTANNSAA